MRKSTPKLPPTGERSEPRHTAPKPGVEGKTWSRDAADWRTTVKEYQRPIKTPKAG